MSRGREILAALMSAQAGGFLAQPPGIEGESGLGIPGVSGVPRGRTWDAVVSAHAPDLPGNGVAFVALDDGTLVTEEELPDDSLAPLAEAVEQVLSPPYRVAAVRTDSDVWSAVAEAVAIVELRDVEGERIDFTVVNGTREVTIDGQPTTRLLPALDALAEEHGDVALHAERVDGHLFAVDVFPL